MDAFSDHEDYNAAYTEKVLLNCFTSYTYSSADRLYQDPEAVALLALARRIFKIRLTGTSVSKQPAKSRW